MNTDLLFEELAAILANQHEAHEKLLEAADLVNKALREGDLDKVQTSSKMLDAITAKIAQLEETRSECCATISRRLGLPEHSRKLLSMNEHAPSTLKARIVLLHEGMKKLLHEVSMLTISNRVLLHEGLDLIQLKFGFIHRTRRSYINYRRGGKTSAPAGIKFSFVNRVV